MRYQSVHILPVPPLSTYCVVGVLAHAAFKLILTVSFQMMIGARHIVHRQFIPGFDEDDSERRMYLMEFMLVAHYPNLQAIAHIVA